MDAAAPARKGSDRGGRDSPLVSVRNLVKRFGKDAPVLNGVNFDVYPGEVFVIMGGSGCGKSTLLRHLTGVFKPTEGTVALFGKDITRMDEVGLLEVRLRFGMVFQFGALLESLSALDNVALPLRRHTRLRPEVVERTALIKLRQVGMEAHASKKPSEISGGQKKRVGLARALALDPQLLFSDEPTSGLDPVMTATVDDLTVRLTGKIGATAVVVSHDMASVFRIASRILMLGSGDLRGTVVEQGTPEEIRASGNPIVQQFIQGQVCLPEIGRRGQGERKT